MYLVGEGQQDVAAREAAAKNTPDISNQTRLKLIKHYVHIGLRFEESLNVLYASWKTGADRRRCWNAPFKLGYLNATSAQ